MTAIWRSDEDGWRLVPAAGFPDEASLHDLVEQAPHILPLAGAPRAVVVGREVQLGGNWADLIAVETTGRLSIIEIKLGKNAEARRAVVAQVLAYAAFLHGLDRNRLEQEILGVHLRNRGYPNLAAALTANDQEGSFDEQTFSEGLVHSLEEGQFRLVLVLDDAPQELVRLVGYLEAIADKVIIDLVTVASYDVNGARLIVPLRVAPERQPAPQPSTNGGPGAAKSGYAIEGKETFVSMIEQAPPNKREQLGRLVEWAAGLEAEGLATLWTYVGKANRSTLLPYVPGENAGLVTIWNEKGGALSFWRSVFNRRAPQSLARIEAMPDPPKIGQGTYTREISEPLLGLLTDAYREAASVAIGVVPEDGESRDQAPTALDLAIG